jgi:hypothetical protein
MNNKTKESSIMDFTYLSLDELESQVVPLFPNEKDPEGFFHMDLLGALPFRMIVNGWDKEELLEFFTARVEDAIDNIAEWDAEDEMNKRLH